MGIYIILGIIGVAILDLSTRKYRQHHKDIISEEEKMLQEQFDREYENAKILDEYKQKREYEALLNQYSLDPEEGIYNDLK
jgi:hypothetical protein